MAAHLASLVVIVPIFLLTGCDKRVSDQNIDVLERQQVAAQKRPSRMETVDEGLTMKEVEAVLGVPDRVAHGKVQRPVVKEFDFTTWIYVRDGTAIELAFVDGKLQGKVPKFGEQLNPQAPLKRNGVAAKTEPAPDAAAESAGNVAAPVNSGNP